MLKMTVHYGKRMKYTDACIFDVPTEVLLESIYPLLSDIDLHNLGEASGGRIKEHAALQVQLGMYITKLSYLLIILYNASLSTDLKIFYIFFSYENIAYNRIVKFI